MSNLFRPRSHAGPFSGALSVTASAALLVSLLATTAAPTVLAATCDNAASTAIGPYGTAFSYCTDQTARPADGTSFIRLGFNTPTLPSSEFVLSIQVQGGQFVGGTDDFGPSGILSFPRTQIILTGGAATLPSAPGTAPDPGDQLWLASTTPGTATVTIGYSTGIFVADSINSFTFTVPVTTVSTTFSTTRIVDASTGADAARGSDDSTVTSTAATGAITPIYLQTRVRDINNAIIVSGATVTWTITGPGTFAISNCPLGAVGAGTSQLSAAAAFDGTVESCDIASTGASGTATIATSILYLGVTYALSDETLTFTAATSTLDQIYAALRPANLRTATGETVFTAGETGEVQFFFDLVNTSDEPLVVPLTDYFGTSFHLVGTEQAWFERLGPDPTIPVFPWNDPIEGRKGTWYAAGGQILALEDLPGETIQPHQTITRPTSLSGTAGLPAGDYRYHVEYKPLGGGLFDVIASVTIDLTFVTSAHSQIVNLLSVVDGQHLGPGTSLDDKLVTALAYIDAGQTQQACDTLHAFLNQAKAQSGNKLTVSQAAALTAAATQIRSTLGC